MEQVSILKVVDKDSGQEALAIVRAVNGLVALTLSLEHEGDVMVAFSPSECDSWSPAFSRQFLRCEGAVSRCLSEQCLA